VAILSQLRGTRIFLISNFSPISLCKIKKYEDATLLYNSNQFSSIFLSKPGFKVTTSGAFTTFHWIIHVAFNSGFNGFGGLFIGQLITINQPFAFLKPGGNYW